MYYTTIGAHVEWTWGIALPLIAIVVLMGLGIPMWVSMGIGVSALLYFTDALPLSLLGETLFEYAAFD